MKNASISLLYFMKFSELIALFYMAIFMTVNSTHVMQLHSKYTTGFNEKKCKTFTSGDESDNCFESGQLQIRIVVMLFFVWMHVLH